MIYWLLQSAIHNPDLAAGRPPAGLLSGTEARLFDTLKTDKRRRDWILGRWTAKQLLQRMMVADRGCAWPFDAFTIYNRDNGAPAVFSPLAKTLDLTLSISHAGTMAFCATVPRANWPLGADLERVEARDDAFVADFFTAPEISLIASAPAAQRDTLITAIWSAKEAALKALQLGLTVDTRAVSCDLGPSLPAPGQWLPLTYALDPERLGRRPPLAGWWALAPGFALTLAAQPLDNMAPIKTPWRYSAARQGDNPA